MRPVELRSKPIHPSKFIGTLHFDYLSPCKPSEFGLYFTLPIPTAMPTLRTVNGRQLLILRWPKMAALITDPHQNITNYHAHEISPP